MTLSKRKTKLVLDALSGRVHKKPLPVRDARQFLRGSELYVLEVLDKHRVNPVAHAAFLIEVMKLEKRAGNRLQKRTGRR